MDPVIPTGDFLIVEAPVMTHEAAVRLLHALDALPGHSHADGHTDCEVAIIRALGVRPVSRPDSRELRLEARRLQGIAADHEDAGAYHMARPYRERARALMLEAADLAEKENR